MIDCGVYYPTNSFWHRISGGVKLLLLTIGLLVLCYLNLIGLLIGLLLLTGLILTSRLSLYLVLRLCWRFKWLLLIVFVADLSVPGIDWSERLLDASMVAGRLAEMLILASWFSWTTKPLAVVEALDKIIGTRSIFRTKLDLPLMLMLILRLVPELLAESENIVAAQRARGISPGFKWTDARFWVQATLIPLFILGIRRAGVLAMALEARGYVLSGERSRFNCRL